MESFSIFSESFFSLFSEVIMLFALLYLRSDSTTVPLADAKLSGPCDAF